MKRPEYVATVVKIYRDAIDGKITPNSQKSLAQIFNREFTTAYLEKNPGKFLISDKPALKKSDLFEGSSERLKATAEKVSAPIKKSPPKKDDDKSKHFEVRI